MLSNMHDRTKIKIGKYTKNYLCFKLKKQVSSFDIHNQIKHLVILKFMYPRFSLRYRNFSALFSIVLKFILKTTT